MLVVIILTDFFYEFHHSNSPENPFRDAVGQTVKTHYCNFIIKGISLVPEGRGDFFSSDTLQEQHARECHVTVNIENTGEYEINQLKYQTDGEYLLINGEHAFYPESTRGIPPISGSSSTLTYYFMIPSDVLDDATTIDFYYLLLKHPHEYHDKEIEGASSSDSSIQSESVHYYCITVYELAH